MCERSKIDRTLKENERVFSKIMTTRQVTLARGEKLTCHVQINVTLLLKYQILDLHVIFCWSYLVICELCLSQQIELYFLLEYYTSMQIHAELSSSIMVQSTVLHCVALVKHSMIALWCPCWLFDNSATCIDASKRMTKRFAKILF